MATEYGVFNAEGCVERQLWALVDAEDAARDERRAGDPDAYASALCDEHEEQPAFPRCEPCAEQYAEDVDDAQRAADAVEYGDHVDDGS